jgi:hypothetical protein
MLKLFAGLAAILLFLSPTAALARDTPPPLLEMWVMTPKAGAWADFHKALSEHLAFRAEHGDSRSWQAYSPVLGDNLGQVAVRYCCFNWSDQDAYREWSESTGAVSKHFSETVGPHLESIAHNFESIDWGNSHWDAEGGPYRYFAVTEFKLKAGKIGQFDAARDKISQIALNQGWASDENSWVWASSIGGEPREAIIVPHRNFAGMEQGDESFMSFLGKHLGSPEAARELMQQFSEATWGSSFQIWEHVKDLSMKTDD